jgi:hypothetical protein
MLRLLIVGGFDETDKANLPKLREFAQMLGKEVIGQGHQLLNACRTSFDADVAESANTQAINLGLNPSDCIVSYVLAGQIPIHTYGKVRTSQLTDWELGNPKLKIPEPIDVADAVIVVGGFTGTHRATNWTRISGKPLLPIPRFGGAAENIYAEELASFDKHYSSRLTRDQFEDLAQLNSDLAAFAKTIISLAERVQESKSVLVIMSFSDDPLLGDANESFKEVCKEFGYECNRIDEENDIPRVMPELLQRLSGCAFCIVDLSDEKANVFYELGYAEGAKTPVVVTAKKGTSLPFDVKDIPVIFWDSQKTLKEQLRKKINVIAAKQGR